MPFELLTDDVGSALPIHLAPAGGELPVKWRAWAAANGFSGEAGQFLVAPGKNGAIDGALFGIGDSRGESLALGALARKLPEGVWRFEDSLENPTLAAIALGLGGYAFTRYRRPDKRAVQVVMPQGADVPRTLRTVDAVTRVRDLINTPTNDMGPSDLEAVVRSIAGSVGAEVTVIAGDDLLAQNFPMIHAVGRASADAPRLIDMRWGRANAPKVTLVGKGVCFDTGGLDIKPSSGMLLMKKDMGGAANVIGLASMLIAARADIRLRVLIPAVENSIAGNAFRPMDILKSRKGITVEVGNTDAEGRLILADALALADEEEPDLLIDMATLTGAARVALGPDLPPFFTDDEILAAEIDKASRETEDPLWRLPLWKPYLKKMSARAADTSNVTTDGFAGAITAALFLQRFVERSTSWAHFDVYGWNPVEKPWAPIGGEAQAIRALEQVILGRYGAIA